MSHKQRGEWLEALIGGAFGNAIGNSLADKALYAMNRAERERQEFFLGNMQDALARYEDQLFPGLQFEPPAPLANNPSLPSPAVETPDELREIEVTAKHIGVAVQADDTLWGISARELGPNATHAQIEARAKQYQQINNITDPRTQVRPGMRLLIPPQSLAISEVTEQNYNASDAEWRNRGDAQVSTAAAVAAPVAAPVAAASGGADIGAVTLPRFSDYDASQFFGRSASLSLQERLNSISPWEREYRATHGGMGPPEMRPVDTQWEAQQDAAREQLGVIFGGPIIGGTYALSRDIGMTQEQATSMALGVSTFMPMPNGRAGAVRFVPEEAVTGLRVARGGPNFLTPSEFRELPATGRIDPMSIRYAQDSISSTFKPPYGATDEFIAGLRSFSIDPVNVEPIRIVEYEGKIFTLDHRRLYSFQQAGVPIPYRNLDVAPKREAYKFTTPNNGTSIIVKEGK